MIDEFRFCPHCGHGVEKRLLKNGEPHRHVCGQCGTVHFHGPKLAAGVVFLHEGKLVLSRRDIEPGKGLWSYPGGFVERGERVSDAARREAREEVHADVEIDGLLGVYSYPATEVAIVVYYGRNRGVAPKPGDEVQEVQLFSPDEIPWHELAFRSVHDCLKDYLATLDA